MKNSACYSINRRNMVKGSIAVGALAGSGVLASNAIARDRPKTNVSMVLFTPNSKAARAFAVGYKAENIRIHPVEDDVAVVLYQEVFPALRKGDVTIVGCTPGHVAFTMQELLRDRGYTISESRFANGSETSAALLSAPELNSVALVEWTIARNSIRFRV
ncbi:MAG: hypothetical protein Pars2KO_05480 [Parasphingorhabdus sp.]